MKKRVRRDRAFVTVPQRDERLPNLLDQQAAEESARFSESPKYLVNVVQRSDQ